MMEYLKSAFAAVTAASSFTVLAIFFILLFFMYYIKISRPEPGTVEWILAKEQSREKKLTFFTERYSLSKNDYISLSLILICFVFLALFNLGSTSHVEVPEQIEYRREHSSLPEGSNHINNMYFDEIYFVRTAVEHIEGGNIYEWTHPPLGKNIMAASILLFGSTPFGWRLIGALCGVIMLAVMYIFLKNLFGKTAVATCGTLLLGFEFCRLVQSRIGTIDTYVILFILLSYFFMYRYVTTNPDAPLKNSLLPLGMSGLFFGLSFAVKWIGFYAGAGLLLIYIIRLVLLKRHYMDNDKPKFALYFAQTFLYSILFFIIIPLAIYYINYIPYIPQWIARGSVSENRTLLSLEYLKLVWANQVNMFNYHSGLEATHSASSFWWQWIFDIKPILFVRNYSDGLRAVFGAFGNPIIYWAGLLAMMTMAVRVFAHRDAKALFILIGYLAGLLPWVAVTRVVFAYHYYASSLFLILALAHIINTIFERKKPKHKAYAYGFTAVAGAVFAIFYPMLSGLYLPAWYYAFFTQWLPTWGF
ncbi:MAG: glycosyltransferase family 39 protein [Oscillospiraceae bacterium]|nr:glycosyltransferase family 39 protein [Oscillospiraceae bacterium]